MTKDREFMDGIVEGVVSCGVEHLILFWVGQCSRTSRRLALLDEILKS